jgi:uncharacterized protein
MGKQIPMVGYLVLDEGEPHLVANQCAECGARYFDRRNACASCGSDAFERSRLGTTGVVRTFTIIHRAAPGVATPYVSAVVDLDGGGSVKANLVDVEPDPAAVGLGMAVRLTTFTAGTDDDGSEAVAFGFAPAPQQQEVSA